MSKVCKSCGKYYEGEYCTNCGYGNKNLKVKAAEKYKVAEKKRNAGNIDIYNQNKDKSSEQARKNNKKNLLIFVVIIAIGVIAAGLVSSGVFSSREKTDVINNYFDAINERDFDKYISCFPSEMKKDYKNDRKTLDCSKEEYMDMFVSDFEEMYGKGFSISVKLGKEKLLEEYSMDGYKEAYGTVPDISEAYVVSVTVTLNGSESSEEAHMECYVGKVLGSWKLFNIEQVAGTVTEDDLSSAA